MKIIICKIFIFKKIVNNISHLIQIFLTFRSVIRKGEKNMYNLIPPYGTLQDVVPGDPWQPESAARYNAVNELLRQEPLAAFPQQVKFKDGNVLYICNVSDRQLSARSAVQIDSDFAPSNVPGPNFRNICAYGKPVENIHCFWGVALENIPPGMSGEVQISGIAAVDIPETDFEITLNDQTSWRRKIRQNFVFPGLDGKFHCSTRGGAEIVWFCDRSETALVKLGVRSQDYNGMFAVIENGDGTLTVRGGETDLIPGSAGRNMGFIEDTVIPVKFSPHHNNGSYICLVAKWKNQQWELEVVSTKDGAYTLYIPGEQIYWELARYDDVSRDGKTLKGFQQLWTGGVINFRDRYFING